jgi:hypothetical protein
MSTLSVSTITNLTDIEGVTLNIANVVITGTITSNAANFTAATISDSLGNIRDVPFNAQTAAYILQFSDQGKIVSITTGGVTVPNAVFSQGDNISIYNNSSSDQTITSASDVTMYFVGTSNTASKTLAQRGIATVICVAANTFVITGGGLT